MIEDVFVGLSTIDVVYSVTEFPEANTKVSALSQEVFTGGPATNAAITFSHLGGKATLVSAVGCHPIVSFVREELNQFAVNHIDLNTNFAELPAISSVAVDATGRRNVISANATRIDIPPATVDVNLCGRAKVVMVDGHAMQACQAWASAAKANGTPVVLDGGSWKAGTAELLKSVHTVICSADFNAPGCASEDELVQFLKGCGVTNTAITHGAQPVRFFSEQASGEIAVPQVDAVDTMGAGDVFHGAFCYLFAAGKAFEEALQGAAEIASESCRYRGPRAWMEQRE